MNYIIKEIYINYINFKDLSHFKVGISGLWEIELELPGDITIQEWIDFRQ